MVHVHQLGLHPAESPSLTSARGDALWRYYSVVQDLTTTVTSCKPCAVNDSAISRSRTAEQLDAASQLHARLH